MTEQSTKKPKVRLSGTDGNIFALGARASTALERAGLREEAAMMRHEICQQHSYEDAIGVICKYVDAR